MNITLTVVVAAIVILITALVVITIFGSGMTNVGTIAQAASMCTTQCKASCDSTGEQPITWNIRNIRYTQSGSTTPTEGSCADAVKEAGKSVAQYVAGGVCDCAKT